ncbi:hypothetical protein PN36_07115 [Candidatus Thiomargarita nelsonii]|uniref:CHAT domain-containing protein n=1 Tax=Candidatus Thiomargarita nelsonii TaxID=1003181 RepID=A0A4E0QRS8_9GAMM|nr:hypothetical protein PN36_07115 [Candidatus Thiomargarita nelsonii]
MPLELNLHFPDPQHIIVSLITDNNHEETELLDFTYPLTDKDYQQIRWYLEKYATPYSTDIDFDTAGRIVKKLPNWGQALFNHAFSKRAAHRLFKKFKSHKDLGRLLTISAQHPAILALPWELMHGGGNFLICEVPRISIRRRQRAERKNFQIKPKQQLHLLFVRPTNAEPVLNALKKRTFNRITIEFLRPATLKKLQDRLENKELPQVDILHFDGHCQNEAAATKMDNAYLVFENNNAEKELVPPALIAKQIKQIPLIILSGCQDVASSLSAMGAPFVFAMSASMLPSATQKFFDTFYEGLAQGHRIGVALDAARLTLYQKTERREIQRNKERIKIHLHDWFLPAFYQRGQDIALLSKMSPEEIQSLQKNRFLLSNLPKRQAPGFFGRQRELSQIEHCFMRGKRRITLNGFSGQGKTSLAQEAGRWLHDTGLFKRVVFVDYANSQGLEPVSVAVSAMADVLQKNLLDADAATEALRRVPTLLIFDNVDFLTPPQQNPTQAEERILFDDVDEKNATKKEPFTEDEPNRLLLDDVEPNLRLDDEDNRIFSENAFSFDADNQTKHEKEENTFILNEEENKAPEHPIKDENTAPLLLDAAKKWSEAGQSGVIIITRHPTTHPAFLKTDRKHCQLTLDKLDEQEAIGYFEALMNLPPLPAYQLPKRAEVEQLCQKINYHPLSLKVLAFQLKNNNLDTLSERLDSLLRGLPGDIAQTEKSLLASLNLFLENLESQMQPYLLKLGIFQNGAFENVLQGIINIPQVLWQKLRQSLEASGFMQAENIEGVTVPYLKFHPAITPRLWAMLPSKEQQALKKRYYQGYYEFSSFLYEQDNKNPYQARAIEQREISNLLQALHEARGEEWSPQFANQVKSFLVDFGLITDRNVDTEKTSPTQTPDWFIARTEEAEQLYSTGDYQEAQTKFQEILAQLGEINKYDRCVALGWLGRCMAEQENIDEALDGFQQGLEELEEIETSPEVKQETGYMQSYLGAVLKEKGDISDAKQAYEAALPIMQEMGETQTEAVIEDQLGTLEMLQGNLPKAERYHRDALKRMQPLNTLKLEAQSLHNLGTVYQKAKHWKAAAESYQKAAKLFEEQEDAAGAAQNWALFAQTSQKANNLTDTEKGYRKAIEKYKVVENGIKLSKAYRNLAELLDHQQRLDEAREVAEAGLAIDKTLEPNVAEIWTTYKHLANIAEKQEDTLQAQSYRRLARQTQVHSAEGENELRQHQKFVDAVVATINQPELRGQLESMLQQREKKGWSKLAATIRRILDGERDCDSLCEDLDFTDSVIVNNILQRIVPAPQEKQNPYPSRLSW